MHRYGKTTDTKFSTLESVNKLLASKVTKNILQNLTTINESPHSKLWGICGANSRTFVAGIRFAAPKDAACHPTLRFIPAASCGVFSLHFIKNTLSYPDKYLAQIHNLMLIIKHSASLRKGN